MNRAFSPAFNVPELFLDIETIPTEDPQLIAKLASKIKPPGNYRKPETIEAWLQEEGKAVLDESILRTALDGTYGRIVCIGWAFGDAEVETLICHDERELISTFFNCCYEQAKVLRPKMGNGSPAGINETIPVVGHAVRTFDLRFLWQRAIINREPPLHIIPWHANQSHPLVKDTMEMWNPDREKRVSLETLCRVLGLSNPKEGMNATGVYESWLNGEYEAISNYCSGDVLAVREIYRRLSERREFLNV